MVIAARILHLIDLVMWHRIFCILFFACAWGLTPVMAQGSATGGAAQSGPNPNDVFRAAGLAVDVTAESALAARSQALRNGQRRALAKVLRRLTLRADHAALPQLDDKSISELVATVQVSEEKTSSVRYLANLTVSFQGPAVRRLLRDTGIRFSETRAKPTLVLPVFEKSAALSLFEKSNIWLKAWQKLDLAPDSLMPLLLPKADFEDITTIAAKAAVAGSEEQLRGIARRYGVDSVLVTHAVLSIDLEAGGVPRLLVNLLRFTPRGKSTEVLDYSVKVEDDLDAAMDRLAARVALDQLEQWKRRTQMSFDVDTSLSAQVPLSGLADWLAVRERLNAAAMVRTIKLQSISRQDAQVVIDYLGDTDSLVVSLAQRDLNLSLIDGFWVLRLAGKESVTAK